MKILVLNAGSSSQKSCLYDLTEDTRLEHPLKPLWEAKVDWTHHQGSAEIEIETSQGTKLKEEIQTTDRPTVIAHILETLWQGKTKVIEQPSEIAAVGHRVVHGGREYRESVQITEDVKNHFSPYDARSCP